MFVPIVLDPCAFYEYRYLWEYLNNLYHCHLNKWPLIASEEYFDYRKKRPVSNVYEKNFYVQHQYRLLKPDEEDKVKKYYIPNQLFDKLKEKLGSQLAVKIYLLQNRYIPLEHCLKHIFRQIKDTFDEPVEGILTWGAHFKSIKFIAKRLHIPVITNEFSIRFPDYYPLSYFCLKDIYSQEEIKHTYNQFLNEQKKIKYRLLQREEILALFLSIKHLELVGKQYTPEYEIGIAGCHPLIATFFAKSMYTDLELIQDVRNEYREEDILFRQHPGDEPYQARYTLKNRDHSESAIQFILKCERITAQGSNVLLEAMLWGKKVFSHDVSPFTYFCENNLHNKEMGYVDEIILNFIFFVYMIPYNKVWNSEYLHWRLKEKRMDLIYNNNLEYYFKEQKIPLEVLNLPENKRLNKIIEYRRTTNEQYD